MVCKDGAIKCALYHNQSARVNSLINARPVPAHNELTMRLQQVNDDDNDDNDRSDMNHI